MATYSWAWMSLTSVSQTRPRQPPDVFALSQFPEGVKTWTVWGSLSTGLRITELKHLQSHLDQKWYRTAYCLATDLDMRWPNDGETYEDISPAANSSNLTHMKGLYTIGGKSTPPPSDQWHSVTLSPLEFVEFEIHSCSTPGYVLSVCMVAGSITKTNASSYQPQMDTSAVHCLHT